jgi:hypothetical protein
MANWQVLWLLGLKLECLEMGKVLVVMSNECHLSLTNDFDEVRGSIVIKMDC